MEAVEDELRCPVCLELFECPIILPCSHILCRSPCAERLFVRESIRCPVCRDNSFVTGGVERLPRVISLEHIIDQFRIAPIEELVDESSDESESVEVASGPDDIQCQLCEERPPRKATQSCLHCNASYCQRCLALSHPNKEPFSQHRLVEPRKYPKPQELRCPQHHAKDILQENLTQAEECHTQLSQSITNHQESISNFQHKVSERRLQIMEQFDTLVNEVETKREFFLSDLEYEEKSRTDHLQQRVADYQKQTTDIASLMHYTKDVLKETEECAFIQSAKSVNEKVRRNLDSARVISTCAPAIALRHKVVDLRKERVAVKDIAYLSVPSTPEIDVSKVTRSNSSIVIVLCPPERDIDVLDAYKVYYCSEEQKKNNEQEILEFRTPGEERYLGRGTQGGGAVCLIHNNLESDTRFYFSVKAYNAAGESDMSEPINVITLSHAQNTIPVPEILEDQCRTYSYSIQIYSPSPLSIPPESGISHYLVYRESSLNKIWKSLLLYGRVDHRVFGLEPNTLYDFVIMACETWNGECQVSNQVTLRTERSAY
ncbi:hypothetical protein CAPTEDRAFT_219840 [Capitella teleta]|uniref:RING-type domain-containing protein n=1 Tax=Capitella teleta TaxID=283909 RepID=R7VIQ6_CAPTE|nr:hypothetical protein CAPTEDRAFT_219840 [Capitella teleta]|eukprot:ELU18514.1 hypothetical protein CAPTEDRAFT_219840 [Capitella teleta]